MTTLPTDISYGRITGRIIRAIGDTENDPDEQPDAVPAIGNISLTPSVGHVIHAASKTLIVPEVIRVTLDENGEFSVYLVASDDPDLNPVNWTYTISFAVEGVNIAPFSFYLPSNASLDISSMVPVPSDGGEVTPIEGGGADGFSAYEVAVANGFVGTEQEWLESLVGPPGPSAYDSAVANGFVGTEQDWLASLEGQDGNPGPSAYEVAVANGFVGTEQQWLTSLEGQDGLDGDPGTNGASAYEVAVANGFVGTEQQWLDSLEGTPGSDGSSAYEVAVANGFVGTEAEWLASLQGQDGLDGDPGPGVAPGGTTGQMLVKVSPTDYDTQWVDPTEAGSDFTMDGVVQLDSFPGASDEARLTEALSYAAAQTKVPAIQFPARQIFLSQTREPFSGMKLIAPFGAEGPKNLHLASGKYVNHEVRLNVGNGASSWMVGPAANLYNVYIGNLAFRGNASTNAAQFWSQTAGTMYSCQFHSLTHFGFYGVFGNRIDKCLNTQINLTGFWVNLGAWDTQFHFGGSDSQFWYEGFINYDANAHPGGTANWPKIHMDSQSKSVMGYVYITSVEYWLPLLITGSSEISVYGGTYEGYKTFDQVYGSLARIENAKVTFYGTYFAQAMNGAAQAGHDGVIQVNGGRVVLSDCVWDRGATAASVPFAHVTAGTVINRDSYAHDLSEALVLTSSGTGVVA